MGNEIDYENVLADLQRQRGELDDAVAAISRLVDARTTLPATTFLGMSISKAIQKHLRATKEPQTASVIARGLEAGGIVTRSQDFTNTVFATLRRIETSTQDVRQVAGKKWALAEWEADTPKTEEEMEWEADTPKTEEEMEWEAEQERE